MPLTQVQAPQSLPVSVPELRAHLRLGTRTIEDALLEHLLRATTSRAERELRRALITQTWMLTAADFPCGVSWRIPKPPLASVTWVKYLDATGVEQTLASTEYVVEAPQGPNALAGRLVLANGKSWPVVTFQHPAAVSVQFVAGYGAAKDVPEDIRHGILMLAAHLYEMREPVALGTIATPIPMTVEYFWSPYRALEWQ
jgi:uncharacterized phiE125 gp8 family phage protein